MTDIVAVRGLEKTDNAFRAKLVQISQALGINPDWLATVISFESKGTFAPDVQNPSSHATGLIQFLSSTASHLGTSLDALRAMSNTEQLDWVYTYLAPYKGRMRSLDDTYLAVFMPSQMGKNSDSVVASQGSTVYDQNSGFDTAGKGYFTVGDITSTLHGVYNAGVARGRIAVAAVVSGAGLGALGIGLGIYLLTRKRGL